MTCKSGASEPCAARAHPSGRCMLDQHISLAEGSLTVTGFERADDAMFVSVARADQPGEGSITLAFDADPCSYSNGR